MNMVVMFIQRRCTTTTEVWFYMPAIQLCSQSSNIVIAGPASNATKIMKKEHQFYHNTAPLREPMRLQSTHLHKCHVLLAGPNGGRVNRALSRRKKKRSTDKMINAADRDTQAASHPCFRVSVCYMQNDCCVLIETTTSQGFGVGGLRVSVSSIDISTMVKAITKRRFACPFDKWARLNGGCGTEKCTYNGGGFPSMASIKIHIKRKHPKAGVWSCPNCKFLFCNKSDHVSEQRGCDRRGVQKRDGQETLWKGLYMELFGDVEPPSPYISTILKSSSGPSPTSETISPPALESLLESVTTASTTTGETPLQTSSETERQLVCKDLLNTAKSLMDYALQFDSLPVLYEQKKEDIQKTLPLVKELLQKEVEDETTEATKDDIFDTATHVDPRNLDLARTNDVGFNTWDIGSSSFNAADFMDMDLETNTYDTRSPAPFQQLQPPTSSYHLDEDNLRDILSNYHGLPSLEYPTTLPTTENIYPAVTHDTAPAFSIPDLSFDEISQCWVPLHSSN